MTRSALLTALATVLLAAAGVSLYARSQVADSRAFGARAASALEDDAVRTALAERLVGALSDRLASDALVIRPLAVGALARLAGTSTVRRTVAAAVERRHAAVMAGDRDVGIRLVPSDPLLATLLAAVSRRAVERLPAASSLRLGVVPAGSFELTLTSVARRMGAWAPWLAVAALVALIAAALSAGSLRAAMLRVGVAVVAAGLLVAALVAVGGAWLVTRLPSLDADAVEALWSALLGDLRTSALIAAAGGTLVAALAAGRPAVERANRLAGAAWRRWSARREAPAVASVAMVVSGAALLVVPGTALRVLVMAAGVALALVGLGRLAGTLSPAAGEDGSTRLLATVGAAGVITTAMVALVLPGPATPGAAGSGPPACQGAPANCALRLDQALFPGTHNAYAAADEPGWYFASQRHGIARQLRDGIRALLLDVHYGITDPASGVVRTDLAYEGSSRNKVVRQLGRPAVRVAEQLAGRLGRSRPPGERRLYLCHTLCELGAEPLREQLELIEVQLATDPDDVVVLVVEPYVPAARVAAAFRAAGLDRTVTLDATKPMPTLGELVAQDRRLVVLAEDDGGEPSWYQDAFTLVQDTPLGARTDAELECSRFRGTADAPLLMLNHWIPPFPPSVRDNARIGGTALEQRIAECGRQRDRDVSIVAVDFYERSEIVDIARRVMAARAP